MAWERYRGSASGFDVYSSSYARHGLVRANSERATGAGPPYSMLTVGCLLAPIHGETVCGDGLSFRGQGQTFHLYCRRWLGTWAGSRGGDRDGHARVSRELPRNLPSELCIACMRHCVPLEARWWASPRSIWTGAKFGIAAWAISPARFSPMPSRRAWFRITARLDT